MTDQLQGDRRLVGFNGFGGGHVAALMHTEELARRPTVVGGNVDTDNLRLCDCAAGAGVRGQVNGARAAEEARVLRIQEE